jgi:hypothetical protein
MVLGLVYFWQENREYFQARFGKLADDDDYLQQAIAIVERGLAPQGPASAETLAAAADDEPAEFA